MRRFQFRWNDCNLEHIAEHGVDPYEAERIVAGQKPPYPLRYPDDKFLVRGHGAGGRLLQVVYILDDDGTVYVIHARPLSGPEKRRYRRRTK